MRLATITLRSVGSALKFLSIILNSSRGTQNIQSTNWQTIRFKPPPANSPIGWRVEFRPMEVQPTDFANAAFAVFIVLLSRAILHFGLNFYLPISKVRRLFSTPPPLFFFFLYLYS